MIKTRISYIWQLLISSFWFIPSALVLLSIVLASFLLYLDTNIVYQPSGFLRLFFTGDADSARTILSTTAGAMIGVAGTVFSITLVALTLASSQFGPRLLQNFMHDKLNQVVLGTYIATFIYCLLILRTVKSEAETPFVPNLSVLFTLLLCIANILLLVVFIHHISISIQADQVIANINKYLHTHIKTLFPEELGEEPDTSLTSKELENYRKTFSHTTQIRAANSGYLQAVDNSWLMQTAKTENLFIQMPIKPGDFLVQEQVLAEVYSKDDLSDTTHLVIQKAFILGSKRTATQDAEFAIHQLVEIAARALSPGINDPYTAITCIDNLSAIMCHLTKTRFPSSQRFDAEGELRVETHPLTFSGMMDAAFNPIRQYSEKNPAVVIRMMEALSRIARFSKKPNQQESIQRHVNMLYNSAQDSLKERNDFQDLKKRYEQFNTTQK
ncbi:MAG: DUF2254 domain-containing protein [Bacteroidales bacterium]